MKKLWKQITPSDFAWEREALEFLRAQLPDHEPYRAWANFEFIAQDGSINEVDLLVLTPKGLFFVEIKSHPGEISGDNGCQATGSWQEAGLSVDGATNTDAAWYYPEPKSAAAEIKDRIAFWKGVEVG